MAKTHIYGYSDQISLKPGERIRFMVSVEGATRYRAEIVRLINGDANPDGPGPKEETIATPANGEYPGRLQPTYGGSHIVVDDPDGLLNIGQSITVHAFIMPTTPGKGAQGIITHCDPDRRTGWALMIDEQGRLALWLGDGEGHLLQAAAPEPLMAGLWYSAGASYDGAHRTRDRASDAGHNAVNSRVGRVAVLPAAVMHASYRRSGQLPFAVDRP